MRDYCANCGATRSVVTGRFSCFCTWAEQASAADILRRCERQRMKREGKRVIVDQSRTCADNRGIIRALQDIAYQARYDRAHAMLGGPTDPFEFYERIARTALAGAVPAGDGAPEPSNATCPECGAPAIRHRDRQDDWPSSVLTDQYRYVPPPLSARIEALTLEDFQQPDVAVALSNEYATIGIKRAALRRLLGEG